MHKCRFFLSVAFLLASIVAGCAGDDDGGGASSCNTAGRWNVEASSDDPACGAETIEGQELTTADPGCTLTLDNFDPASCVYMQQAECNGYVGTLVLTIDSAGTLSGTTTIERDDGTTCDYETTGRRQ